MTSTSDVGNFCFFAKFFLNETNAADAIGCGRRPLCVIRGPRLLAKKSGQNLTFALLSVIITAGITTMSDEREERRESTRVFFTLKENIGATIQTHGESLVSLPVSIISVSSGGFGFVCDKEKVQDIIKVGDRITITDIQTPEPLGPLATLEVEVKHIQEHESDKRITFGSSFTKASDALRNKIQNFVEYRHSGENSEKK